MPYILGASFWRSTRLRILLTAWWFLTLAFLACEATEAPQAIEFGLTVAMWPLAALTAVVFVVLSNRSWWPTLMLLAVTCVLQLFGPVVWIAPMGLAFCTAGLRTRWLLEQAKSFRPVPPAFLATRPL